MPIAAQPEGGALGRPGGGAEDQVWSGAEMAVIGTTYTKDEFQVEREAGTRVRNLERTVTNIERSKKTGAIWVIFQDGRQGLVMSSIHATGQGPQSWCSCATMPHVCSQCQVW